MKRMRTGRRLGVLLATFVVALVVAGSAFAHAHISPAVATTEGQLYTLVVPTESETAATTQVELTPPAGFSLSSFRDAPGWKREVQSTGEGEDTVITKVTWSGGNVGPEQAAFLDFFGSADDAKTYAFKVRQTYSDGKVVDWAGPESSDEPAPTVKLESSLGGGGDSKTLEIVALVLGAIALVVGIFALIGGSGRRSVA
jgi:uncharacterized protein YcnI